MAYGNRTRQPLEDGTILLFKNDEQRNDKDPRYKGHGKAGGVDVWASAWVNESRDGKPYFKIKLKPKQDERRANDRAQAPREREQFDDEIPF